MRASLARFANTRRTAIAALFVGALLSAQGAWTQETSPQKDDAAAQSGPRAFEPGFLHALGRWFHESVAGLKGASDRAGEAAKDAAGAAKDAAKDAADKMARLPGTRIVGGRERCEAAANGAPDCRAAADAVCRGKGFGSGRSLDIESAEKCPARIWLSGRRPAEGECPVETFVTRALCQ